MSLRRQQLLLSGLVQGVGFRPHAYRIAVQLDLTGWVQNHPAGVLIEVQGQAVEAFYPELTRTLPPLARINAVQTRLIPVRAQETAFEIIASQPGVARSTIAADTVCCSDCLKELFDPASRYHGYPFLNCTQCGPRFTITRQLPYDRVQTALADFPLCAACLADYHDPANRRYHAQPTACQACGPQLSMPLADIARDLREGKIVAIKGLGGYQLVCDAANEKAVSSLRQRKQRAAKPFALMVLNAHSASQLAELNDTEQALLVSPARPIVLLRKKNHHGLPETLAPGLAHWGVMLPATPLHYLLFHALLDAPRGTTWLESAQPITLVATSANQAGNPLVITEAAADAELSSIADRIVSFNRPIVTRADDSVLRVIYGAPLFIRRARGFVPDSIALPNAIPTTLALGGELKNTVCITRGQEAFISQHLGGLNNRATIEFFHETIAHWTRFLGVSIERVACDLHPDFYTSQWASQLGYPVIPVQHHHAHLAAVAAEHQLNDAALGLVLDGYGYGMDGNAWGGELFQLTAKAARHQGSFFPLPQPGGEQAAREPWRMAAAVLRCLGKDALITKRFALQPQAAMVSQLLQSPLRLPATSSCGRLFDAASALLGVCCRSQYEGQAAMQLESLVTAPKILPNGWYFDENQFNLLPTLAALLDLDPVTGANVFHGSLIAGLADWVSTRAQQSGLNTVLLSGGCFINQILTEGLLRQLQALGLSVYLPQRVPVNDGGLSLGQAWVAGNVDI